MPVVLVTWQTEAGRLQIHGHPSTYRGHVSKENEKGPGMWPRGRKFV